MSQHEDHGNTPAAWTTVITLIIASCVAAVAVIAANIPLAIAAAALAVVGVIAGKALSMAGFGKSRESIDTVDAA